MRSGVSYEAIDDAGLHLGTPDGPQTLQIDNVIVCAGQESALALNAALRAAGSMTHVIGGALLASEIDAERAIREGTELAARL
jgi:2,4-dienoyl-CoA reductase (NADPH2)